MTNSIWHKASEKPELNKYVVVRKHGFAQWKVFKFDNKTTFYEPFTDDLWAYLTDIVLQADKAERLEKENEAMREEFEVWHGNHKCVLEDNERLQKAVDLAVLRLEQGKKKFGKSTMGPNKETAMLCEIVIDEIKQLIKGE